MDNKANKMEAVSIAMPATATEPMTNADLIVAYLQQLGISHIFGVPGGSIEPFFDAVARAERKNSAISLVVARHETGAAFMADGYARERNQVGVCCSTTGPGATNLLTGVSSAYVDNVPLLVITAQTPLPKFGRQALQDSSCAAVDIVGMFRHCTKYNSLISHPNQLLDKLMAALVAATTAPKGPVHLSIPADILNAEACPRPLPAPYQRFSPVDLHSVNRLVQELVQAKRIALYVGDNCHGCGEQIQTFAEKVNAAVISGPMGKRWVDETHPQYCGVFGFSGHTKARQLVMEQRYDLMLAIGTRMSELGTSGWEARLLNDRLIHLDDSVEYFSHSSMACLHVLGDLKLVFAELEQQLAGYSSDQWQATADFPAVTPKEEIAPADAVTDTALDSASDLIAPAQLMRTLAETLPASTRVFIDAGNAWAWATRYFQRPNRDGHYRIAMGYGSMAWAIGASVGSAVANPQAPQLCITGDGSYLMSGQEITTAVQQQVPLVILIMNDSALGMVKHGQRLGGAEQIGFELPVINFAAVAQAMGADGLVITCEAELAELDFAALFSKRGPTLLDVRIDPEAVPPMGDRVKGLATSKQ